MKITKKELVKYLDVANEVTSKKSGNTIFKNVLFEFVNGKVKLKAVNDNSMLECLTDCESKKDESFCVDLSKVLNISKSLRNKEIEFSKKGKSVNMSSGDAKIRLSTVDSNSFPVIEFEDIKDSIKLNPVDLFNTIVKTFSSISDNESMSSLTGLNVKTDESSVIFTGFNSFRMTKSIYSGNFLAGCDIIIPKKELNLVKKIISTTDSDITIKYNKNSFYIETESVKFKTRLVESKFPDVSKIAEIKPECRKVSLPKDDLIDVIKVMATVIGNEKNVVVKMFFENGTLKLETDDYDYGKGSDVIECEYDFDPFRVGLNIKFLLDSVNVFDGAECENINFHFTDDVSPVFITSDVWQDYKTVLMPMRVIWE